MLIYYLLLFILGGSIASFADCLVYRIIKHESLLERSKCDHCLKKLKIKDLIPIFSFLINKGKCRYCNQKISIEYLITEIVLALLFLILGIKYKLNIIIIEYLILITILSMVFLIDYKTYLIYNILIIVGIINRIIFILIGNELLINSIINALLISVPILFIKLITSYLLKKETMGLGDIYLLFMLGLYTNVYNSYLSLLLASIIGLVICLINKKDKIPFGPCICIGYVIVIIM